MKIKHRQGLTYALIAWAQTSAVYGAKIGDLTETSWIEQAMRFWSFTDPSVQYAVMGTILMGICCGLLGSFIVVRKLALMGDALSHAVLPGVALGFLWNMSKDPVVIFIGATIAGLLGAFTVHLIQRTTHIKEDSALGMVLAGFYAVGICLFNMIQNLSTGNKSGLDRFMFGQASALAESDVQLMAVITLLSIVILTLGYKGFLLTSFDGSFARAIGIPYQLFHYTLMVLLAFAIVVSIQATGVVLVTALLIIPAATAYLLTDRMHWMLILAAGFGALSGVLGAFFSFLGNNLPTGPFMVVSAASLFVAAFMFAPQHGWLPRWWRRRSQSKRIQIENTLKAIYQVLEQHEFEAETISFHDLAARRNVSLDAIELELQALSEQNLITSVSGGRSQESETQLVQERRIALTPDGWNRACQIVRNHRLWELYLTHSAHYEVDHVHEDAEKIEHILGEDTVRKLEKHLNNPSTDPHGKTIPSQRDIESFQSTHQMKRPPTGYQNPNL